MMAPQAPRRISSMPLIPPRVRGTADTAAMTSLLLPGTSAVAVPEPSALFLGHPTPYSLDRAGIKGAIEAARLDLAAGAYRLGLLLLPKGRTWRGDGKEQVGVAGRAGGTRPPLSAALESSH